MLRRLIIKWLFAKFVRFKTPIENRTYPYETKYGDLSVDQANSIQLYLYFGWEVKE